MDRPSEEHPDPGDDVPGGYVPGGYVPGGDAPGGYAPPEGYRPGSYSYSASGDIDYLPNRQRRNRAFVIACGVVALVGIGVCIATNTGSGSGSDLTAAPAGTDSPTPYTPPSYVAPTYRPPTYYPTPTPTGSVDDVTLDSALVAGDCVLETASVLRRISCSQSHDSEVYYTGTLSYSDFILSGTPAAGREQWISDRANELCAQGDAAVKFATGIDPDVVESSVVYPKTLTYKDSDNGVVCLVNLPTGRTTRRILAG